MSDFLATSYGVTAILGDGASPCQDRLGTGGGALWMLQAQVAEVGTGLEDDGQQMLTALAVADP